ncbi:MAG TPA: hypothetical protein VKJ07_23715 [Mycobacteriales bacterium]|nr:hypothetical protein [Mycobacteriales bacterium]
MAADIEPPELARLVDFAERGRTNDWSLRAALVRYAQPQPQRVNDILDLVRRVEWALDQHAAIIGRDGHGLQRELQDDKRSSPQHASVIEVLRTAGQLDHLGDILAAWAVDRAGVRPDNEVDSIVSDVAHRLDALGIPHEERPPRPRSRG